MRSFHCLVVKGEGSLLPNLMIEGKSDPLKVLRCNGWVQLGSSHLLLSDISIIAILVSIFSHHVDTTSVGL